MCSKNCCSIFAWGVAITSRVRLRDTYLQEQDMLLLAAAYDCGDVP